MTKPSRYTPSSLPGELLEELFVERHDLLDEIMQRIIRGTDGDDRTHTLLVGPRGAGKTHLVVLVAHRTRAAIVAGLHAQLAWLPEDLWTVDSVESLLRAIADELQIDGAVRADLLDEAIRRSAAADGVVVVIVENLDEVLSPMGDLGQQRLRRLLTSGAMLMVATTTKLSRHLSDQARPFYGFFTTTRLQPFDVDVAAQMLTKLAVHANDDELVRYLGTPSVRARLTVVEHLAGGAPRMWATLASALSVGELDRLVDLMVTRFDDLTPYYQERLGKLSSQQRKVVAKLAELDRAVSVKELAVELGLAERSIGKAVSDLKVLGWIQPIDSPFAAMVDRRRTYYELAEPMARLAFQIKAARGQPIRLMIEFLKSWFDRPTLESAASTESRGQVYAREALRSFDSDTKHAAAMRLSGLPASRAPIVDVLKEVDAALEALGDQDASKLLSLPNAIRRVVGERLSLTGGESLDDLREDVHGEAMIEFGDVPNERMNDWIDSAARFSARSTVVANWLANAWRFEEAELALTQVIEVYGEEESHTLLTRGNLAHSYRSAERFDEAITIERQLLTDRQRILGPEHPDTLLSRGNLATSYWSTGRFDDAIAIEEQLLTDRQRILGPNHPDTLLSRGNLATSYWSTGRIDEAVSIEEQLVADSQRILGPEHPDTLLTRGNLGHSYWSAGRFDEAITIEERLLSDRQRILGPDHTDTLLSRGNLATSYCSAGRFHEAVVMQEQLLVDRQRILGPDHPDTLLTRSNLAVSYRSAGQHDDAAALESHSPNGS